MSPDPAVGVDIGGTKIMAAVVNGKGLIGDPVKIPTPHGPENILNAILQLVAAVGPPDVKFIIGKDFILNNYRFGFNLLYGDPIGFNKLVFKGTPDQGQLGGNAAGGI